jgi:imidazole glycerol-phosphate synthase subunit HisH
MIVILDYGIVNSKSILNMIKKCGKSAIISSSKKDLERASAVIIPGIGSYDKAMQKLNQLDLMESLNHLALVDKVPILGICLGMQLFFESSEEGVEKGFGWLKGKVKKFNFSNSADSDLKVPHMGWNSISYKDCSHFSNTQYREERYYFVHSYYVECKDKENILAICTYGSEFTCSVFKDNIFGVQFHPEKSHSFGISFFKRFFELTEC